MNVAGAATVVGDFETKRGSVVPQQEDGWMDGRTDGWIDGWMDGWMDGAYRVCQECKRG